MILYKLIHLRHFVNKVHVYNKIHKIKMKSYNLCINKLTNATEFVLLKCNNTISKFQVQSIGNHNSSFFNICKLCIAIIVLGKNNEVQWFTVAFTMVLNSKFSQTGCHPRLKNKFFLLFNLQLQGETWDHAFPKDIIVK